MGGYVSLLTVTWAQPPKSQLYHWRLVKLLNTVILVLGVPRLWI